jgi:hypothetical protein
MLLALPACSISAKNWDRTKAHLAANTTSAVFSLGAFALGGLPGVLLFFGGIVVGCVVDTTLEPEPEVVSKETVTVVQVPTPLPDGTPRKPRTDTFVTTGGGARGDLKIPGPSGFRDLTEAVSWWEQVKRALQFTFWVVVAMLVATAALANDKLRAKVLSLLRWVVSIGGVGLKAGAVAVAKLRVRKGRMPPAPPSERPPGT